jgi:folylpolyglutamate synthase/dihydropteroate synthase
VHANATEPITNKYLAVSAFNTADTFPDGGSVAIQIINNGPKDVAIPVTLQGVEKVKDVKTYLLDNKHNLGAVKMCARQGDKILATVPSLSMIVMSISH